MIQRVLAAPAKRGCCHFFSEGETKDETFKIFIYICMYSCYCQRCFFRLVTYKVKGSRRGSRLTVLYLGIYSLKVQTDKGQI